MTDATVLEKCEQGALGTSAVQWAPLNGTVSVKRTENSVCTI